MGVRRTRGRRGQVVEMEAWMRAASTSGSRFAGRRGMEGEGPSVWAGGPCRGGRALREYMLGRVVETAGGRGRPGHRRGDQALLGGIGEVGDWFAFLLLSVRGAIGGMDF